MILPIAAYGLPVLRQVATDISPDYPDLQKIIQNLWETMYASGGVGLAAPQINQSIRVFVIDANPYSKEFKESTNFKKVFINAHIIKRTGEEWSLEEGCLSIPDIREEVSRPYNIRIKYVDEQFNMHDEVYEGIIARIIQHEYDHLDGVLFIDRINSLKRTLLKKKLSEITKGNIKTAYKMIFPRLK
ncbi:MAG TPA: peptide deformylase [Bacteroidales bacterium]|nr:peptide deformylase [Bacteroidales bacterium]